MKSRLAFIHFLLLMILVIPVPYMTKAVSVEQWGVSKNMVSTHEEDYNETGSLSLPSPRMSSSNQIEDQDSLDAKNTSELIDLVSVTAEYRIEEYNSTYGVYLSSASYSDSSYNDSYGIYDLQIVIFRIKQFRRTLNTTFLDKALSLLESRNNTRTLNGMYYNPTFSNSTHKYVSTLDNLAFMLIALEFRKLFEEFVLNPEITRFSLLQLDIPQLSNVIEAISYNSSIKLWYTGAYVDNLGSLSLRDSALVTAVSYFAAYVYSLWYSKTSDKTSLDVIDKIQGTVDTLVTTSLTKGTYPVSNRYFNTSSQNMIYFTDQIYYLLGVIGKLYFFDTLFSKGTDTTSLVRSTANEITKLYTSIYANFQTREGFFKSFGGEPSGSDVVVASDNYLFIKTYYQFDRFLQNASSLYEISWGTSYSQVDFDNIHSFLSRLYSEFVSDTIVTLKIGESRLVDNLVYRSNQYITLVSYYNIISDVVTGNFEIIHPDKVSLDANRFTVGISATRTELYTQSFDLPYFISLQNLKINLLFGNQIVNSTTFDLDRYFSFNFTISPGERGVNTYSVQIVGGELILLDQYFTVEVFDIFKATVEPDKSEYIVGKSDAATLSIKLIDLEGNIIDDFVTVEVSFINFNTFLSGKNLNELKVDVPLSEKRFSGNDVFTVRISSKFFLNLTISTEITFVYNQIKFYQLEKVSAVKGYDEIDIGLRFLDIENDPLSNSIVEIKVNNETFFMTSDEGGSILDTLKLSNSIDRINDVEVRIEKNGFENLTVSIPVNNQYNEIFLQQYPVNPRTYLLYENEITLNFKAYDLFGKQLEAQLIFDDNKTIIDLPGEYTAYYGVKSENVLSGKPIASTVIKGRLDYRQILTKNVKIVIDTEFNFLDVIAIFNILFAIHKAKSFIQSILESRGLKQRKTEKYTVKVSGSESDLSGNIKEGELSVEVQKAD